MSLDFYDEGPGLTDAPPHAADGRPYVCILFECCQVYARIYRQPDELTYVGRCPKCLRTLRMRVGPDGTANRFFRAS